MASGQKSHNAPTEEFILASPAPVDVAAKISAIYRILAEHVSIQIKSRVFLAAIIIPALLNNLWIDKNIFQEKDRAIDLTEAANFSEAICNDLVSIASAAEPPGAYK